jgi:hypothetical protein
MKTVLIYLTLSILMLSISAEELSYAQKSLQGLENRYRSLLARMNKVRLRNRKELQKEVNMAKSQWMLQASLLGKKEIQENNPLVKPFILENKTPDWIGVNHTQKSELKMRELPDVEEWFPNYGKSGKERRDKPITEKIVKVDSFKYSKSESTVKRTNTAKKVLPWQLTLAEQSEVKGNPLSYSSTRVLQFAVPPILLNKKWWLWRKIADEAEWLRVYRFGKAKGRVTNMLPQAKTCVYKFTPELKNPGDLKADYKFIIDTEAPEIKEFMLKKNKEGLMQITWEIAEKNLKVGGITVSVIGEENTVLSTHASSQKRASIPVPKNHARFISKIEIDVVDLAGNETQKAL